MRHAMKVTIPVLCLIILCGTGAQCGAPFPFTASNIADPPAETPATGPGIGIDPVLPAAPDGTPPGVVSPPPGADPTPIGTPGDPGPPIGTGPITPVAFFGDGSAGERLIVQDEDWSDAAQRPTDFDFTTLTVSAQATLTVPSGLTLRCTQSCLIRGTIVVLPGAVGGSATDTTPDDPFDDLTISAVPPESGISIRTAKSGPLSESPARSAGGLGGVGLACESASQFVDVAGLSGGGGGAAGRDQHDGVTDDLGGAGGGSLRILCGGIIRMTTTGSIRADGGSGSGGGGGGGIVLLAAVNQIRNDGIVSAAGGSGENSDSDEGPSGGGGGGLIAFVAPSQIGGGRQIIDGGSRGEVTGAAIPAVFRFGGGGGGASVGDGGHGGHIPEGGIVIPGPAADGKLGCFFSFFGDPTPRFGQ